MHLDHCADVFPALQVVSGHRGGESEGGKCSGLCSQCTLTTSATGRMGKLKVGGQEPAERKGKGRRSYVVMEENRLRV